MKSKKKSSTYEDTWFAKMTKSPDVLLRMYVSEEVRVRKAVAANSYTPKEVLVMMANDKSMKVRRMVAANKNTPKRIVSKIKSQRSQGEWDKEAKAYAKLMGTDTPNNSRVLFKEGVKPLFAVLASASSKKMSSSSKQVAQTIIEQLGGMGKLKAMLGAKFFSYHSDERGGLNFRFRGSRKANHIKITLTGKDLYDVVFTKIMKKGLNIKKVKTFTDIYADQMKEILEEFTGLYLSL